MNFKTILKNALTIKFDKAFGLDISDCSIEIIELEKVFKFAVTTYGRAELPEGIVENGQIKDQGALAEKLKKLLKEAKPKRVSTNKVVVSLPETQTFVHSFEISSKLRSSDLSKAVSDHVSLLMPINLDKTYWDFIEIPLVDNTKKMITFIAVPKDIANSYVRFCNSIGLEVVSLCTESLSLARTVLKSSVKQSLILDIGSNSTNFSFFDSNDRLCMSVSVPVAGAHMTKAVKDGLKIDTAEAELMKVKMGFKEGKDNTVRPLILPLMQDIIDEVKESIEYYETTFNQKLDDIYLIGGSALLPGIVDLIKGALKKEVLIATNSYGISLNSLANKINYFPLYANVIGLGMLGASGEFRDMNLLKQMPSSEVNAVNKLNLISMGYLSKVNTFRTIMNNRFVLTVMIILIGIIFAVLVQQAKNYGFATAYAPLP